MLRLAVMLVLVLGITLQFGSDQVTASSVTSIEKAMKPTDNNYINPSGRFNGTIERDTNGVIRAVKFVQR